MFNALSLMEKSAIDPGLLWGGLGALGGAGVGGLGGYLKQDDTESPEDRKRRILNDALLGAGLGGVAGGAGGHFLGQPAPEGGGFFRGLRSAIQAPNTIDDIPIVGKATKLLDQPWQTSHDKGEVPSQIADWLHKGHTSANAGLESTGLFAALRRAKDLRDSSAYGSAWKDPSSNPAQAKNSGGVISRLLARAGDHSTKNQLNTANIDKLHGQFETALSDPIPSSVRGWDVIRNALPRGQKSLSQQDVDLLFGPNSLMRGITGVDDGVIRNMQSQLHQTGSSLPAAVTPSAPVGPSGYRPALPSYGSAPIAPAAPAPTYQMPGRFLNSLTERRNALETGLPGRAMQKLTGGRVGTGKLWNALSDAPANRGVQTAVGTFAAQPILDVINNWTTPDRQ